MVGRKFSIVFALLALLSLTGTECVFVAKSGSSSTDEDQQNSNLVVIIKDGRLIDAPVEGVSYRSGALAGITGSEGEFQYQDGGRVEFFIGDIALGQPVAGKAVITPLDLVPQGSLDSPAVINIARLLQSLDAVPGDDTRITIPAAVRAAAVRSGDAVASAIRFLDFADESAFANSAAQLVATLTAGYPFTAVLVDAQTAQAHLRASLRALDGSHGAADPVVAE
jgi:hypothetical protein